MEDHSTLILIFLIDFFDPKINPKRLSG